MDHSEAVKQMATERFLLDELTPEERDEFEAHVFDCPDCALDLRAGAAFVDEAKAQLPQLVGDSPAPASAELKKPKKKAIDWFSWWRPAFAGVAFASLLVIGYQNLVTFPELREAANQPRLLPWASLHGNTRGGGHLIIAADRGHGVALPVDLSGSVTSASYASYSVDLLDPQGKVMWTGSVAAPDESQTASQLFSLVIPGAKLGNGQYAIAVSGVTPQGDRNLINRYVFEIHMKD